MVLPEGILIVHDDDFRPPEYGQYTDERYFRLFHSLKHLSPPQMPEGFCLCDITPKEFADHINSCYDDIGVSEAELYRHTMRPVYDDALWIAVQDRARGAVAAIPALPNWIRKPAREFWSGFRSLGPIVGMDWAVISFPSAVEKRDAADFATVSGQCGNPSNPERLYRACGFTGTDVWHILRKSLV